MENSGIAAKAYGDSGSNVTTMENLYQPYMAVGPNNTTSYVFFRDGYVSGQWGFNYGSEPTWTAASGAYRPDGYWPNKLLNCPKLRFICAITSE